MEAQIFGEWVLGDEGAFFKITNDKELRTKFRGGKWEDTMTRWTRFFWGCGERRAGKSVHGVKGNIGVGDADGGGTLLWFH